LDTSMRTLAAGVGTSNRMLNYHFGSREQLLTAVIERVCEAERQALERFVDEASDPMEAGARYWSHIADTAEVFAPLFYELSSHAMYREPYAEALGTVLCDAWLSVVTQARVRFTSPDRGARLARLCLEMDRGALFDMALTGDRAAADVA